MLSEFLSEILVPQSLSAEKVVQTLEKIAIKPSIIVYEDLKHINSLEELFADSDVVFILYQTIKRYVGHWTVMINHPDFVEYFDSYGHPIDWYLKHGHTFKRQKPRLLEMAKTSEKPVIYNQMKLQKLDNSVATCGKWAILRVMLYDIPLEKFQKLFSKPVKLTPDQLVSLII